MTEPRAEHPRDLSVAELAHVLLARWRLLLAVPVAVGVVAWGLSWLMPPRYTAKASFLPPQQAQSGMSAALASLGPLAQLGMPTLRSPSEQYVALMQSTSVSDRIIERFGLVKLYDADTRADARQQLQARVRFTVGKKDGLIYLEADDSDPKRAADLGNAHIDELRRITSQLAVTEAQQRRAFFEAQLEQARDRLTKAQIALQRSGFSQGALKAEPRAAAETYSKLRAEVTAAEVRVQTLRGFLSEQAPELRQALLALNALRQQVARAEQSSNGKPQDDDSDYITMYREFKYQETLFDLFARQYEMARVDESREGSLVQVVDAAQPPEKRSGPRRVRIAAASAFVTGIAMALVLLAGHLRRRDAPSAAA